jgi:hypothetical protein
MGTAACNKARSKLIDPAAKLDLGFQLPSSVSSSNQANDRCGALRLLVTIHDLRAWPPRGIDGYQFVLVRVVFVFHGQAQSLKGQFPPGLKVC